MAEDGAEVRTFPVNPLNDILFKYLFAAKENRANLLRLLNDVLGPKRRVSGVECLDKAGIRHVPIKALQEKAYALVGRPDPLRWKDRVVAILEARDGSILDVVREVMPYEPL